MRTDTTNHYKATHARANTVGGHNYWYLWPGLQLVTDRSQRSDGEKWKHRR